MNEPPLDNLELRLREATTWTEPATQVWKRSLTAQTKQSMLSFDVIAFAKRRWFPLVSATAVASLAFALLLSSQSGTAPFIFASFGDAPSDESAQGTVSSPSSRAGESTKNYRTREDRLVFADRNAFPEEATSGTPLLSRKTSTLGPDYWPLVRASGTTPTQFNSPSQTDASDKTQSPSTTDSMVGRDAISSDQSPSPIAAQRHVIHKATLELATPDVRAAFLKAGLVLNEALGEHVQDSSLTGGGETASATLTLRVAASRLSEVSNALRELGTVVSERREGQDVTGQVIDVEARLRNEQRVEQELLALFDQRKDAPLKDVLDLRQKLSEVRSGIEQLVAQRDQLSRLVSLATVLVIIRTGEKPPEPAKGGLWDYFGESIGKAWHGGLRGLADTVAALLAIFVGGLIWWVLLAVALLLLRRYMRNRGAKV